MRRTLATAVLLASACSTNFEDPTIVIDLRTLSVVMEPPEIVVPFDPENPTMVELADTEVCALVADPGSSRQLYFEMTACAPTDSRRCDDPALSAIQFGSSTVDDPDESPNPVAVCATLLAGPALLAVLDEAIEADSLGGFGGVPVQVSLFVRPAQGSDDQGVYAAKRMLYSPKIPEQRVANNNPTLAAIQVVPGDAPETEPTNVVPHRCADTDAQPFELAPGRQIEFTPVDAEGAQETYVIPAFDGTTRQFTENLTYAWFATAGEWSAGNTGGPKDAFGNDALIENTWTAPSTPGLVELWTVVRDERGGQVWYPMCARVRPELRTGN